jgi:hypothetical protein
MNVVVKVELPSGDTFTWAVDCREFSIGAQTWTAHGPFGPMTLPTDDVTIRIEGRAMKAMPPGN